MTVVTLQGHAVAAPGEPDHDLLEYIEALLERVLAGKTVAIATVEVEQANTVAVGFCNNGNHYHQLNSGAARLAARLATMGNDG